MADIITTLHPENDENTNLYPNIKKANIPNSAINYDRLDDDVKSLLNSNNELSPQVDTSTNILAKTQDDGVWIGSDTGKWYYWNGTQYVVGGDYVANITNAVYHQGNQLKDTNNTDFYPNIDLGYLSINGNKVEKINGNINLFNYGIVNKGITSIASDGTITADNNTKRFYNSIPIHLYKGDYVTIPNDGVHVVEVWIGISGVWSITSGGWKYKKYNVLQEADYIFLFGTTNNSDDFIGLLKGANIFHYDSDFTNLLNSESKYNDITSQYVNYRTPKNILDNSKLLIGKKRVWNNPTTLTDDANFVTWDYLEIYETGVYYFGRGNGTAQSPNPAIVWDSEKNYVKLFNNGDTLEKGQYISITLGLATYNAWKNTLILTKGSISTYFVAYFNPYYIVKPMLNPNIDSIAHQGINEDATQQYGRNLLSSYVNASKLGFNYGECDVVFSSDNIPVCCHDETFVDGTTSETITIANHTYEELITYDYYGGTIASLDEVVKTCKEYGIGLWIDHLHLADNSTKLNAILGIIDKYRMVDNIWFVIGVRSIVQSIQSWNIKAKICIPLASIDSQSQVIGLVEEYHNDYNEVGVSISYTTFNIDAIKTLNSLLPSYAKVSVYTIDDITTINTYKPYVNGIVSNVLTVNK